MCTDVSQDTLFPETVRPPSDAVSSRGGRRWNYIILNSQHRHPPVDGFAVDNRARTRAVHTAAGAFDGVDDELPRIGQGQDRRTADGAERRAAGAAVRRTPDRLQRL